MKCSELIQILAERIDCSGDVEVRLGVLTENDDMSFHLCRMGVYGVQIEDDHLHMEICLDTSLISKDELKGLKKLIKDASYIETKII